jgi:starch-binding outer membrane protein, SusD/RagB family
MKKKFLYIIICMTLLFTACKDFLDVSAPSGFTEEYVFSSEAQMRTAITGVYSRMTQGDAYGYLIPFAFNPNTDVEATSISTDVVSLTGNDIACYQPKPTYGSLNSAWNAMYGTINLVNAEIEGMEKSDLYKEAIVTNKASTVLQIYGELKVLRAMMYLDMIRIWGDVVFNTKSSSADDEMVVGVTDRNKILGYLIDELITVEPNMQYAADLDYGVERASREFCQGLIGLLAMNRAGWTLRPDTLDASSTGSMERGENYDTYYDIAIKYLGKVISEGKHDLNSTFKQLWYDQCNWTTANCDDILFAIPMLKGTSGRYGYNAGIAILDDDEAHSYGTASGNYKLNTTYLFSFDTADLRRDVTCVFYRYNSDLNQEFPSSSIGTFGVYAGKWSKLNMKTPLGSTSTYNTGIDNVWMRFADVLLLYAEAVNERSGPTTDAKDALKRVRRRAFSSSLWTQKVDSYVDALTTKEDFFSAIMNERKWEFGGEGIRRYDLARWNKFSEVIYSQYNTLINWGKVATGSYIPGLLEVPDNVYYKSITDPENSDRTILDILGFNTYTHSRPLGYTTEPLAINWWALDATLEDYAPTNEIRWSFRGFINFDNADEVLPTNALRYLCPYPTKVITDHRGLIQNYYGFNNY